MVERREKSRSKHREYGGDVLEQNAERNIYDNQKEWGRRFTTRRRSVLVVHVSRFSRAKDMVIKAGGVGEDD